MNGDCIQAYTTILFIPFPIKQNMNKVTQKRLSFANHTTGNLLIVSKHKSPFREHEWNS